MQSQHDKSDDAFISFNKVRLTRSGQVEIMRHALS